MAASVRIEDEAFSDDRFEHLAELLKPTRVSETNPGGLQDADHARGKMLKLWRQCTLENTYELPISMVRRVLGEQGPAALLTARLADPGSAPDLIRIRGTVGRIEWLARLRDNGKFGHKGGRPPKRNPASKTQKGYLPETLLGSPTKPAPAAPVDNSPETHQGYIYLTPPAPAPALFLSTNQPEEDSCRSARFVAAGAVPPAGSVWAGWLKKPDPDSEINSLAKLMLEDSAAGAQSEPVFRQLATELGPHVVHRALSELRDTQHAGITIKSPAAWLVAKCKRLAAERKVPRP